MKNSYKWAAAGLLVLSAGLLFVVHVYGGPDTANPLNVPLALNLALDVRDGKPGVDGALGIIMMKSDLTKERILIQRDITLVAAAPSIDIWFYREASRLHGCYTPEIEQGKVAALEDLAVESPESYLEFMRSQPRCEGAVREEIRELIEPVVAASAARRTRQ